MTAPADLDNEDRALGGEDEVFDLDHGEKDIARGGGSKSLQDFVEQQDGLSDEEEAEEQDEEDEDEILDSEEERELKLKGLEGELDGLYDEYRGRMSERDAKWRVKQARNKDRNLDAWHGIKEGDDGEDGVDKGYRDGMVRALRRDGQDEADGEESEDGGWDVVAAGKAKLGEEEVDSSDEDEESEAEVVSQPSVRPRPAKIPRTILPKEPKSLVTSLQDGAKRAQMSRQAQLWFDQPVFKGIGDLAALEVDDDEEEVEENETDGDEDVGGEEDKDESELQGEAAEADIGDEDIEMGDGSVASGSSSATQAVC